MRRAVELGVREHVVFGGRIPPEGSGFMARSMAQGIPPEFHDRRDWDEIAAWAGRIGAELSG